MDIKDRAAVIEQLALVKGYNSYVFEKLSDEELEEELENLYK